MLHVDWQSTETTFEQPWNCDFWRPFHLQPLDARFDHNLPCRDRTNPQGDAWSEHRVLGAWPKPLAPIDPPDENMGIQQKVHGSMPKPLRTSGGSGASKSSLIQIFPFIIPKDFRTSGFSRATSRAIGFPALAMMISSPAAASSARLERCVLAAWMLTVFMT